MTRLRTEKALMARGGDAYWRFGRVGLIEVCGPMWTRGPVALRLDSVVVSPCNP